jgi:DNA-directed RNA polymerase subunit H (RpoH/RPB5)
MAGREQTRMCVVYNNLYAFIKTRGLRVEKLSRTARKDEAGEGNMLVLGPEERIEDSLFADPVRTPDVVVIEAVGEGNQRTHIALISEAKSQVPSLAKELNQYVEMLRGEKRSKAKPAEENPIEAIVVYKVEGHKVPNRRGDRVLFLPYSFFYANPMEHQLVTPSELLSEEEGRRQLRQRMASEKTMRRIPASDPVAIWLGAAPGRVIRNLAVNEATGLQDECYFVV